MYFLIVCFLDGFLILYLFCTSVELRLHSGSYEDRSFDMNKTNEQKETKTQGREKIEKRDRVEFLRMSKAFILLLRLKLLSVEALIKNKNLI